MHQLDFFADEPSPTAARLGPKLRALAERGVYFGTSSWKYEGWVGTVYSGDRYFTRGRFSKAKFESECLREHAETFPAVCADFTFYQFPTDETWQRLFGETPASYLYAFKVPEQITAWQNSDRQGTLSHYANPDFLNMDLFREHFAEPLRRYRDRVAALIFEFGQFPRKIYANAGAFLKRFEPFIDALPGGFRYAVEIRNADYLRPDYFAALASRNIAHVFNAWERVPALGEQIAIPEAFTADFTVARAMTQRGRSYEAGREMFRPFDRVREPDEPGREALRQLARRAIARREPAFLFVGNRFEGHSPGTIEAVACGL